MVYIVGLKGEVVLRKEIFKANYNAYTLDISSLPTGLYFLKLESEGIQESIKFIKQ